LSKKVSLKYSQGENIQQWLIGGKMVGNNYYLNSSGNPSFTGLQYGLPKL
jgi:hypothetical protein